MVNVVFYSWIIGGTATLLTAYATVITIKAVKRFTGDLKFAILCFLGSLIFFLTMGLGTGVMAAKNIPYQNPVWFIVPTFALIASFLFVCGARKLFSILFSVGGNHKNNKK